MSASPELDQPCGEHFVYRDLIECGETWRRLARGDASATLGQPFANLPRAAGTFAAMRALCAAVLDPLVDRFGQLELTYAFASLALTRRIAGRIYPSLDQHAGHELNQKGKPICERLGLAVDLRVPAADSRVVAAWIVEHTAFDRLYFYGLDRPIHVSAGPDGARQITHMRRGPSGRLVPRVVTSGFFREGEPGC
jgi:hypothetical protein